MVYRWDAAWVKQSAVPWLLDDDKDLLNSLNRTADDISPSARSSYIIPDIIYKNCHRENAYKEDIGTTVSLSDKAAAILARLDRHIELVPHVVRWRDGTVAQQRHILTGFPQLLPLDEKLSRHKKDGYFHVKLKSLDDHFVFDCAKIGSHNVWRSDAIHSQTLFGTEELIDEFLKSGVSGLSLERFAEQRNGVLSGYKHDPSQSVFMMYEPGYAIGEGPVDGNLEAVRPVAPMPEKYNWIGKSGWPRSVAYGVPVLADNMPTKWRYGSKERHLSGFKGWGGVYTVSEQFRDIIDHFEPGLHQFFPVDFVTRKGDLIEKRFIMVICKIIDARDDDRSEPGLSVLWHAPIGYRRKIVVDRAKVAGSHLWLDHFHGHNNNCFVSYELARALEQANPKQLHFAPFPLN